MRIIDQSQDEAEVEAVRLAKEEGMIPIPPFDHLHVIAGQGTIGLELLEDFPELDCAVVWAFRRWFYWRNCYGTQGGISKNSGDRSDYGKRCSHETQLGSRETGSGY